MTEKKFYVQLGWVTVADILLLLTLFYLSHLDSIVFPLVGLTFFFLFSVLIFYMGKKTAMSADKNRFTSVVMSMIFLKLLMTILIVIGYDRIIGKLSLAHILSFLVSYLFFTIYEVFFMSKLARLTPM